MTDAPPITTPGEMLEYLGQHIDGYDALFEMAAARIAPEASPPPAPDRWKGLRERIDEWLAVLSGRDSGHVRSAPDFWVAQTAWAKRLLREASRALGEKS